MESSDRAPSQHVQRPGFGLQHDERGGGEEREGIQLPSPTDRFIPKITFLEIFILYLALLFSPGSADAMCTLYPLFLKGMASRGNLEGLLSTLEYEVAIEANAQLFLHIKERHGYKR